MQISQRFNQVVFATANHRCQNRRARCQPTASSCGRWRWGAWHARRSCCRNSNRRPPRNDSVLTTGCACTWRLSSDSFKCFVICIFEENWIPRVAAIKRVINPASFICPRCSPDRCLQLAFANQSPAPTAVPFVLDTLFLSEVESVRNFKSSCAVVPTLFSFSREQLFFTRSP